MCDITQLKSPSDIRTLHIVHLALLSPPPKSLAHEVKQDTEETPQCNETHVRHNGRNIARADNPGCDEFGEAITPEVLIDSDGHEDRTSHRFVRVNAFLG